jgi:general secretion pathway protein G
MPVLQSVLQEDRRRIARAARHRARPRGMTLIELMIALAIVAIAMGILVGPAVMDRWREAKIRTTKMKVVKYASEAFPAWAAQHAEEACPGELAELDRYTNSHDAIDAWGRPLAMRCGARLPPGVPGGIAVSSVGPDGQDGTDDDIRSWD